MNAKITIALLVVCLVGLSVGETRNEFLNFICKKCEGCKVLEIESFDEEGNPDFDCESKCEVCASEFCTSAPKREECRFCDKDESVDECAGRCQFGCTFCYKTTACKN
eukprot:TRINITY_DN18751_c0_g1_i1.p1 TRINITY_DN18751_c0_g1~~TRINITY_DN18751_c0_g1_i1.p1  ORF type:complete len:119 (-),score=28.55 TRINITY_DN18751_c0_g1_i1:531-854(-)